MPIRLGIISLVVSSFLFFVFNSWCLGRGCWSLWRGAGEFISSSPAFLLA